MPITMTQDYVSAYAAGWLAASGPEAVRRRAGLTEVLDLIERDLGEPFDRCDSCRKLFPASLITRVREGQGTGHSESSAYCPDHAPGGGQLALDRLSASLTRYLHSAFPEWLDDTAPARDQRTES